jgi:phage tail sheath gpL-like
MAGRISEPEVTLSIIPAAQLASVEAQKVLIVGQMLAAGTATGGELIQDHPDDGTEDTLFGQRSHVAGLVREFKKLNKRSQLDILPLDDAVGTQATAVATVTGTATATGSFTLTVGSSKNHSFTIDVTSGDSETVVAATIASTLTADANAPFTTASALGVATMTAANDGTYANEWDIRVSGSVAGISVALTGWTGGATDPTLTTVLSVIENVRYQTILWPSVYALTVVQTEIDARFNVTNDVKDGVVFQTKKGTFASIDSYVSSLNSQSLVIMPNKTVSKTLAKGTAIVEMPDIISAQICAIRALRYTEDAPLTQFLTTTSPTDQFGGIHIASLPYHNTAMTNLNVPAADEFFSDDDLSNFKTNGISAIGPNRAFNGVILGDMITTYLTDTAGNTDTSYKFLNTVDTSSVIREFFFANYKSRYAQSRLTEGDLISGKDMVNAASFRAFSNRLYDELAEEALVQSGRAAKKDFDDNLSIVLDISSGQITVNMAPLLVTQVRIIIGTIQVNFGT